MNRVLMTFTNIYISLLDCIMLMVIDELIKGVKPQESLTLRDYSILFGSLKCQQKPTQTKPKQNLNTLY